MINVLNKHINEGSYINFIIGAVISLVVTTFIFLIINQFLAEIAAHFVIILFVLLILLMTIIYYHPELGLSLAVGGAFTIAFLLQEILGIHGNVALTVYSLTLIGLIFSLIKNKTFLPLFTIPVLTMLGFVFVLYSAISYSPSPEYGGQKVLNFLVFISFPFLAFLHFSKQPQNIIKIYSQILLFGIILGIVSTIKIFIEGVASARFRFIIENPILFSRTLGITAMLLIFKLRNSKKHEMILLISCLPFLLLPIFASGSRGSIFALGLSIVTYELLIPQKIKTKIFFIFTLTISIILIYSFFNFQGMGRIQTFLQGNFGDENIIGRLYYYSIAWENFLNSPLFGIGTGGFSHAISFVDKRAFPHNIFLEIAAENGIIGLFIFLSFLGSTIAVAYYLLFKIVLDDKLKEIVWISVSLMLFGIIASCFSGDVSGSQYAWFGPAVIWSLYLTNRKQKIQYQ